MNPHEPYHPQKFRNILLKTTPSYWLVIRSSSQAALLLLAAPRSSGAAVGHGDPHGVGGRDARRPAEATVDDGRSTFEKWQVRTFLKDFESCLLKGSFGLHCDNMSFAQKWIQVKARMFLTHLPGASTVESSIEARLKRSCGQKLVLEIQVPKAVNHFLTEPEMAMISKKYLMGWVFFSTEWRVCRSPEISEDETTGELRSLPFLTDLQSREEKFVRTTYTAEIILVVKCCKMSNVIKTIKERSYNARRGSHSSWTRTVGLKISIHLESGVIFKRQIKRLPSNQESLGELLLGFFELWGREEPRAAHDGTQMILHCSEC